MKKAYDALRRAAVISPLVLFCFLSLALASKNAPDSKYHSSTQPSDSRITIRLTMSDGQVIMVSKRENEMITTGPSGGEKLGITPRVLDDGGIALDFSRVANITKNGAVIGASITGIGSIELNSARPQAIPINLISSIELIGISKETGESRIMRAGTPCPCCVTCGGSETCGDGVVLSCGSCQCE
jgi:hypothetical protein